MTSFRFHYENDASYLFCFDESCKKNPDFSQAKTTRSIIQHYHRSSWKFVCIWCIFMKLFWILIYKRNSKRHYPDNKNGKLLPPINERRSWKKCFFLQGSYTFINNFWTASFWHNRVLYIFLQVKTSFALGRDIPYDDDR